MVIESFRTSRGRERLRPVPDPASGHGTAKDGGPYLGDDRRTASGQWAPRGRTLVLWASAGAATMLLLAPGVVAAVPDARSMLWGLALALCCTVMLGSGVALLLAWRIGGRSRAGLLGAALVTIAVLVPLVPVATSVIASEHTVPAAVLATTTVLGVAGTRVARAARLPVIDTSVRPLREMVLLAVAAAVGSAFVIWVAGLSHGWSHRLVALVPVIACGGVALWTAAAHAPGAHVVSRAASAPMALGALAAAFQVVDRTELTAVASAVCLAAATGTVAGIAYEFLKAALHQHDVRSLRAVAALASYATEMSKERERRHDALNAVAAIRSASETLASHSTHLDDETREELARAARAELARVERMLARTPEPEAVAVPLAAGLEPTLLAWRHRGLVIDADLGDHSVHAVADGVARIVDNLLQNVHRHAPGAPVRLTAARTADVVQLIVADRGPGIPRQPGPKGMPALGPPRGQGLGLVSAQRLAQELGGDLRLVGVDDGCRFVLSLPCARATGNLRPPAARESSAG